MRRTLFALTAFVLAAASPARAQAPARVTASGAVPLTVGETFTIDSRVLNETRRINVYLPADYSESPDTRWPVLYMPDGGIKEDFLHVAGLVQVLGGNGSMRPFILVGIENTARRRDLTPPTTNPEDRKIAPVVGKSADFRRFIRTELKPLVKERYRTTPESAIVGESLAGLFVVETFLLEPDLFDTYVAFDPSLWWNHGTLVADAEPAIARTGARALYVAASRDDIDHLTQRLADILKAQAPSTLRWHYEPMSGETHATIYHPAALRAFRWLFKPSGLKP
jgi:predicted alpha/beta superfamily hydrolase